MDCDNFFLLIANLRLKTFKQLIVREAARPKRRCFQDASDQMRDI